MAIAVVNSTSKGATGNTPVTTDAIDTSGANFCLLFVSGAGTTIPTDSTSSNTWNKVFTPPFNGNFGNAINLFYAESFVTDTAQTFTESDGLCTICALALSGMLTSSTLDQTNGSNFGAVQAGSVTPSQNDEILIAGAGCLGPGGTPTIDSGFTVVEFENLVGGQHFYGAMAYLIQGTAAAENPTWTNGDGTNDAALIATFKGTGGGGGGGNPWYSYAQQQQKVERTWNKHGLLWHPSYAMAGVN